MYVGNGQEVLIAAMVGHIILLVGIVVLLTVWYLSWLAVMWGRGELSSIPVIILSVVTLITSLMVLIKIT